MRQPSNLSVPVRHGCALHLNPMGSTRVSDRSGLIRASMLIFTLLAIASFALARVAG